MMRSVEVLSGNGVKVPSGPSNVTLPLLLTYNVVVVGLPVKKLIGNPIGTTLVEPSSFSASDAPLKPGRIGSRGLRSQWRGRDQHGCDEQ